MSGSVPELPATDREFKIEKQNMKIMSNSAGVYLLKKTKLDRLPQCFKYNLMKVPGNCVSQYFRSTSSKVYRHVRHDL